MDCTIKTKDFEAYLQRLASVLRGSRDSQCIFIQAGEDGLEIHGGTDEVLLSLSMTGRESYRYRDSGSAIIDYYPLRKALHHLRDKELLRLHTEDDLFHTEDLRGHRRVSLIQLNPAIYEPVSPSEDRPGATVSAKNVLRGIQKVKYAIDWECAHLHQDYEKLYLTLSEDNLVFIAGNGARFAVYEIHNPVRFSGETETVIYLPKPMLRPLTVNLKTCMTDTITFYPMERPETLTSTPSLFVAGRNFRLYGSCPHRTYFDIRQVIPTRLLRLSAMMSLSSWTPVIDRLKDSYENRQCNINNTQLVFDFSKGTITLTTNDPDKPVNTMLSLEAGCIPPKDPAQTTAVVRCNSKYLIDMFDSGDRTGTFSMNFEDFDTYDGPKVPLCQVEFPLQHHKDSTSTKYKMFFIQSHEW